MINKILLTIALICGPVGFVMGSLSNIGRLKMKPYWMVISGVLVYVALASLILSLIAKLWEA